MITRFEELREHDKFGAYRTYQRVIDAKENGLLPESYHSSVPDYCECGAETMISTNMIHVECVNPKCYIKAGYNLLQVYRNFGVVGIGPETCLDLAKHCLPKTTYNSHLELLLLEENEMPVWMIGNKSQTIRYENLRVINTQLPFGELVSKLGIPGWGSSARSFFGRFDSLDHLVGNITKAGGVLNYIQACAPTEDPRKKQILWDYAMDIGYATKKIFRKQSPRAMKEIPITLSGTLRPDGNRVSKENYIKLLNSMMPVVNGRPVASFVNTAAVQSNQFIVSDEMHAKARAAKRREETEGRQVLFGSSEFLSFIKSNIEEDAKDNE